MTNIIKVLKKEEKRKILAMNDKELLELALEYKKQKIVIKINAFGKEETAYKAKFLRFICKRLAFVLTEISSRKRGK